MVDSTNKQHQLGVLVSQPWKTTDPGVVDRPAGLRPTVPIPSWRLLRTNSAADLQALSKQFNVEAPGLVVATEVKGESAVTGPTPKTQIGKRLAALVQQCTPVLAKFSSEDAWSKVMERSFTKLLVQACSHQVECGQVG